jgi:hypothetical protein
VSALVGYIEDIQFRDGEYGMQLYVMLNENEDGSKPVIALQTASREAEDFLKKLIWSELGRLDKPLGRAILLPIKFSNTL